MPSVIIRLAACGLLSIPAANAQTTYEWLAPNDGLWSDSGAWNPNAVPGQNSTQDIARLGFADPYTVVHDVPLSIVSRLELVNPLVRLEVPSGNLIRVHDTLTGPGRLALLGTIPNGPGSRLDLAGNARIETTVEMEKPPGALGWYWKALITGPGQLSDPAVIAPQGTVRGIGQISGHILNEGTITVDLADHDLIITTEGPLVSSGVIAATNGVARLMSGVVGGTIIAGPDARIYTGNDGVRNAHLVGEFVVPAGRSFVLGNGNTFDSTFNVHDHSEYQIGKLQLLDGTVLGGDVRLNAPAGQTGLSQFVAPFPEDESATLAAGAELSGAGQVYGRLINQGTIRADRPGQALTITTVGPLESTGAVIAANGGVIDLNTGLAGGTLSGDATSRVRSGTTGVRDATLSGTLIIGAFNDLALAAGNQYNGEIVVHDRDAPGASTLRLADAVAAGGLITLNAPADQAGRARINGPANGAASFAPTSQVRGSGRLLGNITAAEGTIHPGTDDSRGLIDILTTGTLALSGTAAFTLNGTATDQHDRLTNQSTIQLGGTCRVDLAPGYTPARGDHWDLITGGTITSAFGAFDLPDGPDGSAFRVFYEPGRVVLRLTCPADFDGDNQLNFFDVSAFIGLYNAQDPRADLAAPFGQFNFFDIAAFISNFNAGCP